MTFLRLMDAIDRCSQIPSMKCIRFTVDDVVRSGIVQEIIESYENLTVTALESDPTTCLVEFEFTVVHGLNRIFLTAHISV